MRERLVELLTKCVESPWATFLAFVGAITTLGALVQLLREVPGNWSNALALFVVFPFATLAVASFFVMSFHRQYHLPSRERYMNLVSKQEWYIARDGSRRITGTKTMIFFREPQKEDCADSVLGSLSLGIESLPYESPDAEIIDVSQVEEKMCRVYWKPRLRSLELGVPYVHRFSTAYPRGDCPSRKSITIAPPVFSKRMIVRIRTERPILRVRLFKGGILRRYTSFPLIEWFARHIRHTAAAPARMISERCCEWKGQNLKAGEVHYLLLDLAPDEPARPSTCPDDAGA